MSIRRFLAGTLPGRLAAWGAALTAASVAAATALPAVHAPDGLAPEPALRTAALFGSLAAAAYLTIRFFRTRSVHHAFAGAAFWALACGAALQNLTNPGSNPNLYNSINGASWLTAGVLFIIAARSRGVCRHGGTGIVARTAAFVAVCLLVPAAAAWCILNPSLPVSALSRFLPSQAGTAAAALLQCAAGCILVAALIVQCRRAQDEQERAWALLSYFAAPCALASAYGAAASLGSTNGFAVSAMCSALGWIVLGVGFGVQAALEQTETSGRVRELETLHEISWSVVGAQNLRELLQVFAESLCERLEAKVAAVYLAGSDPDTLQLTAACGPDGPTHSVGKHYKLVSANRWPGFHSGHTARAYVSGELQVVKDVFVDVELVSWRTVGRENGGAVSVPMTDAEGRLGVVNLYFSDHRQITGSQTRLLLTLAATAAPTIRSVMVRSDSASPEERLAA